MIIPCLNVKTLIKQPQSFGRYKIKYWNEKKTKNKRKAKIRTVRFPEGNRNAPNTKTINCEILATPHRKINHHKKYPKWDSHSSCVQLFIPRRKNDFQTNFIISHHFDVCWYCRVIHPSLIVERPPVVLKPKMTYMISLKFLCVWHISSSRREMKGATIM